MAHLGTEPGQKIWAEKLPDGQSTGTISDFVGLRAGRVSKIASLEELDVATQAGWAGAA